MACRQMLKVRGGPVFDDAFGSDYQAALVALAVYFHVAAAIAGEHVLPGRAVELQFHAVNNLPREFGSAKIIRFFTPLAAIYRLYGRIRPHQAPAPLRI